jgi:hypothetical protein
MEKKRNLEAIARGIDGMDVVGGKSKTTPTYTKPTLPTKSTTKTKDTTTAADEALNLIYSGANATKANDYYKKAETPFEFSLDGNALYNQYKDQYTKQAQLAREDAIGKAAAMTGGYGSSYAMTAGDSAYNARMDELNNIIPELYNMAYNQHLNERNYNLEMGDRYASKDQAEMENYLAYLQAQNKGEESVVSLKGLERIEEELKGAKNNDQVNAILNKYLSMMTEDQEELLYDIYHKDESNYKDAQGNSNYLAMFEHPELWDYYDDGGSNGLWGVDRDAGLIAPDGTEITAAELLAYLKKNGYQGNARKDVIKLLEALGIND